MNDLAHPASKGSDTPPAVEAAFQEVRKAYGIDAGPNDSAMLDWLEANNAHVHARPWSAEPDDKWRLNKTTDFYAGTLRAAIRAAMKPATPNTKE